jgi:hypothetical protein
MKELLRVIGKKRDESGLRSRCCMTTQMFKFVQRYREL